jgi:uncharacterized membrane protein
VLPRSLVRVVDDTAPNAGYDPTAKVSLSLTIDGFGRPLRASKTMFVHFPNTAIYSPIPYIPQAAGMLLGRLLGLSPLALLYLGRLANLAVAALLCAVAIKIAPVFRGVLFLTATTPMFIYEAASVSADALTDALSILFIALILRSAFGPDPEVKRRDIALIMVTAMLIGLCKNAYAILALVFFIIPPEKLGSRVKYYAAGLSTCVLSGLASYWWLLSIKPLYVPYRGAANLNDPMNFILGHPLLYTKMVIFNLLGHFVFYAGSFVGYLGWEDIRLPSLLIVLYVAALCAAGALGGKGRISLRAKIILGSVATVGIALVITSQFIMGKPTGVNSIDKSQGRYFVPIAPLVFFLFASDKLAARFERYRLARFVPTFAIASLLVGLVFVIRRYYVP